MPLDRVTWSAYPLHLRHFPAGPPVGDCEPIFCGGRNLRDLAALLEAARRQPDGRPVDLFRPAGALPAAPRLRDHGTVPFDAFARALRHSRFVLLPLTPSRHHAAGITIASLALAAGRPVVASRTAATLDHLRHDADALLVDPGDAGALAAALDRLEDPIELERLTAGARRAARAISVERLAELLCGGAPSRPAAHPRVPW